MAVLRKNMNDIPAYFANLLFSVDEFGFVEEFVAFAVVVDVDVFPGFFASCVVYGF